MPTLIFALPRSIKNNPYLELIYGALAHDARFVVQPFSLGKIFAALARGRRVIIHVHWESNVYGSRFVLLSLLRFCRFGLLFLARALGARVVWTMHNLASHDYPHPAIDRLGRALMRTLAQAIVIQNKAVAAQVAAALPHKVVRYMPHPSYAGVYGSAPAAARTELRRALGVPESQTLLLSLGAVRPYKHLEELIDAMHEVRGATLLIAGKGEGPYVESLLKRAQGARVIIRAHFIGEQELPHYLAAADYALFAYGESSLTSGALILALSYGLPAVTRAMPAAELIQNGVNGYVVPESQSLADFLAELPTLPHPSREATLASVAEDSPAHVARELAALYTDLI